MAGCAGVTGAPEAIQENNLGADTTKFVAVPLDVVFKYFFRAKRSSAALPANARLQWLQPRDLEERSEWVSKFRESTSTLGQVIQEVYTSRDAHWAATAVAPAPKKPNEPAAGSANSPVKPSGAPGQMTLGKPINGKPVALTMKDGTKLCAQFQRNGCKKNLAPMAPTDAQQFCEPTEFAAPSIMGLPHAMGGGAFISCGWSCITVDWLLDPSHDLANPARQTSLSAQLEEVIFIAAALDCSTKSRAREIPRIFDDGRPAPGPLRSEAHPDGLPNLSPKDAQRVATDNQACSYVLGEIHKLSLRGGGSVRD
eukprot:s37_g17.t1